MYFYHHTNERCGSSIVVPRDVVNALTHPPAIPVILSRSSEQSEEAAKNLNTLRAGSVKGNSLGGAWTLRALQVSYCYCERSEAIS